MKKIIIHGLKVFLLAVLVALALLIYYAHFDDAQDLALIKFIQATVLAILGILHIQFNLIGWFIKRTILELVLMDTLAILLTVISSQEIIAMLKESREYLGKKICGEACNVETN